MRGLFVSLLGVSMVFLFSVAMFLSGDIFSFWLFLELSAIGVIPCFFGGASLGSYLPLFSYVVMSSVSSSLVVAGFLTEDGFFLCYVGFLMKFGLFPFMGWIYLVFIESNWLVIWCLSTLSKLPFIALFFYVGFREEAISLIGVFCSVTLILISFFFWVYTFSWKHYWAHVALSSSAVLFLLPSCPVSINGLFSVFSLYFFWSTLGIFLISYFYFNSSFSGALIYLFVGFIVSYPFSLNVLYKVVVTIYVYPCGIWLLLSWLFCGISEQFYLLKLLLGSSVSFKDWGGGFLV